jgi:TonB-linked SusC/RagA family outer membrane protein
MKIFCLTGFLTEETKKKWGRIMRLTFFLMVGFILTVSASSYSQSTRLDIKLTNGTIGDLMKFVEDNSEFVFLYKNEDLDMKKMVNVELENATIQEILEMGFQSQNVGWDVYDRQIVIYRAEKLRVPVEAEQQQRTVTGVVTDQRGQPLPGVTVVVGGTTTGTVTNAEGNFSLTIPTNAETLQFSFIGMRTQELMIEGRTTFTVTMEEETIGLDEVIAVGYGTQKKANLTGSVGLATAERLENRPILSAGQGLQGVIPNLNINIRSGDPTLSASYNVRGFESITGGDPLILIDGVPGDIDKLNPNDIQSVTVLKDAAAGAVYGARAAFGVILVETKRGQPGRMTVTLATEQSATVPIALIDPEEDVYKAAMAWNQATLRTSGTPRYDEDWLAGFKRYTENPTPENEWGVYQGELRRYGFTDYKGMTIANMSHQQKYDLNISGASDNASYYVSFGFIDKEGWMNLPRDKNVMYRRYNVLMKSDYQINEWLNMDSQINWSAEHNDEPHIYQTDRGINSIASVSPHQAMYFPDLPYYLEPGDRANYEQYIGIPFRTNALAYWEKGGRDVFTAQRTLLKQGLTLTPVKRLLVRGDFAYSTFHRESQNVASKIDFHESSDLANLRIGNDFSSNDYVSNSSQYNQYYVMNAYAEYSIEDLTNHNIKVMAGFNQEWGRNTRVDATARTLITPLITDISATTGAQTTDGSRSHQALRGIFYRLNYSFKERYLLEANGRYDGTSRFPQSDRFGFFPSVSAAWRLSNEPFMEAASGWLDNLKIRVSYGTLGNQLLSNLYPYIPTMGAGTSLYQMYAGQLGIPYVSPAGLVSPSLTWETVTTQNIGLDFTMLNQRFDVAFDLYHRDTRGMLMRASYPNLLGTGAPHANAADLRTSGWELAATWRDRIGQDWLYSFTLAFADNQAVITKFDNPTGALSTWREGQKVGEIWGYVTEGIFQTDEEVAAHADQSRVGANWRAGDMKFKDVDGDGIISAGRNTIDDPGDRQIIGNNTERYTFGLNPNIQYKDLALNIFFQGRLKRDYLPGNTNWTAFYPFNARHVETWFLEDSWSPDNPDAYFAAPHVGTEDKKNIQPQSRYVQNAAYVRLKNLTLSYWLPEGVASKIGMSRAQVYLAGMNLMTFSNMRKPLDPEQTATVFQEYYFDKVYSLGIKVTF